MSVTVSIIISLLALLATFYQLYLQRVHNEKSLMPLGQIDLLDHKTRITIEIRNNGLGPLIIDRLTFNKSDNIYFSIEDCLDLDSKSYMRMSGSVSWPRVVQPNACLTVFETIYDEGDDISYKECVRAELSPITIRAVCRDIYNNKITLNRDFNGFARQTLVSK